MKSAQILLFLFAGTPVAAAAQGPPPPPSSEEGWVLLDGVAAQVGSEIVTMRELDARVRKEVEEISQTTPLSNEQELNLVSWRNLEAMVIDMLEAQAGEDMGIDREQIELLVARILEDEKNEGILDTVRPSRGLDDTERRARALYQELWRLQKLGGTGLGGSRPIRDRYIRPGELKMMYRANKDELKPDEIRLRVLVVPIAAHGSLEATRSFLEDTRRRVEAGDDMGDLVLEHGADARDTGGLLNWMPLPSLNHPGLRTFAEGAQLGELSDILPLPPVGEPQALVFARLEEKRDNEPPPFEEPTVQRMLREVFTKERDNRVMGFERALLSQNAYSWLHPGLRRLRNAAAQSGPIPPGAPGAPRPQAMGPGGPGR